MNLNILIIGMSITNSMIGTTNVVLPLNYHKTGIIQNSMATVLNRHMQILMGVILGTTASILVKRMLPRQKQFSQAVKRQLGQKYSFGLGIMASLAIFLLSSVIYMLGSDILYDTLCFFFVNLKDFPQYLFQLITFIIFVPLAQLNNLKIALRFTPVGIIMQIAIIIILIYSFLVNIQNIDVKAFQIKSITFDKIFFWLSINSFSFICHPAIPAILQMNSKKKNQIAIIIGFSLSIFIYLLTGILGSLAVYNHHSKKQTNIIDFFTGKWQKPALGLAFVIYFLIIFPILTFVSRIQIFQILPEQYKYPQNRRITMLMLKILFTIFFVITNFLLSFFKINTNIVISFIGAVAGWYICYFLPIIMRIGILNKVKVSQNTSILSGDNLEQQTVSGVEISFEEKKDSVFKLIALWLLLLFGTAIMIGQLITMF